MGPADVFRFHVDAIRRDTGIYPYLLYDSWAKKSNFFLLPKTKFFSRYVALWACPFHINLHARTSEDDMFIFLAAQCLPKRNAYAYAYAYILKSIQNVKNLKSLWSRFPTFRSHKSFDEMNRPSNSLSDYKIN